MRILVRGRSEYAEVDEACFRFRDRDDGGCDFDVAVLERVESRGESDGSCVRPNRRFREADVRRVRLGRNRRRQCLGRD